MAKVTTADIILAAWEDSSRMIPALWGPPRRGKTWTAREVGVKYTGDRSRVKVVNPALDLPEDIGGLPRVRRGRTIYTLPPAIPQEWLDEPEKPSVLIFDEIDKAQTDTLCCLLTALSYERRIRDTIFPPGLRLVVCGNEPQAPLPEPLTARLINLRFPEKSDTAARLSMYIQNTPAWSAELAQRILTAPHIELPRRPCTGDDSITALISWSSSDLWQDSEARGRILEGLVRPEDIPTVLDVLDREELDKDHLASWLETAPLAAIMNRLHRRVGECCEGNSPKVIVDQALRGLFARAEGDVTGEFKVALDKLLASEKALSALGPGGVHVWEAGRQAWTSQQQVA